MKKFVVYFLMVSIVSVSLSLTGCATPQQAQGTGIGAAVGGIAGALLDRRNPWRGAMIGGALGGVAGASFADISSQAPQHAAKTWKPVEYRSEDGRATYRAEPVAVDPYTKCKKVRERVWEDGSLVKDTVREICKTETGGRYQ